jgi:hypothetical protein
LTEERKALTRLTVAAYNRVPVGWFVAAAHGARVLDVPEIFTLSVDHNRNSHLGSRSSTTSTSAF